MTQIITITANPALDVSTSVVRMAPFTKLRCAPPRRDPGGGGINVARVVTRLGGEVSAIYPAGGAAGDLLRRLLAGEGVASLAVVAAEETREDVTVFDEATQQQYRFVMPGAPLREAEWRACLARLAGLAPAYVVASGSLPPGVPEDFFGRVARQGREMGARAIIDTSGRFLESALREGVYLIKPNLREFQELTGLSSADEAALSAAGIDLIRRGRVELIALSLGPAGAMLIAGDRVLRADGLPITPASVVGAGDSFVAGLTFSLAKGDDLATALRYAVAAGSAAVLNHGTELCKPEDVRRLVPEVVVRPLPV